MYRFSFILEGTLKDQSNRFFFMVGDLTSHAVYACSHGRLFQHKTIIGFLIIKETELGTNFREAFLLG